MFYNKTQGRKTIILFLLHLIGKIIYMDWQADKLKNVLFTLLVSISMWYKKKVDKPFMNSHCFEVVFNKRIVLIFLLLNVSVICWYMKLIMELKIWPFQLW